ncbi:MAG: tyrosinase family protein, partial [Proteobacteria bacterium]
MKIDRRRFLVTSGVSGGLFLTSCKTTSSSLKGEGSDLLVRRRWDPEAEDEVKSKFIKAIDWLKANDDKTFDEGDPRSYLSYKKIVAAHQKSCKHGDWFIFPWHRLYLAYFENACRYALQDASFSVPYWDWTADRRIPEEFFHNPLLMANRKIKEEEEIPEEFVAPKVIEDILASDNFTNVHSRGPRLFNIRGGINSGAFERGPHNGVHNSIGGTMSNPFDSPQDPIFWLHHCNIDRIWASWQQRHPDKVLPYTKEDDKTTIIKPAEGAAQLDVKSLIAPPRFVIDTTPWEDNVLELVETEGKTKGSENTVLRTLPQSNFNRDMAGKA